MSDRAQAAKTRLAPNLGYELWAPHWDAEATPIVSLEARVLPGEFGPLRGRRFIDACCGTGRWLSYALLHGANTVGFDFSSAMLARANSKPRTAGRLARANALEIPIRSCTADLVLCALALGHIRPVERAAKELARVVKTGGRLIVTDFHPEAVRLGWKRTFRIGNRVYEIENDPYEVDRLFQAIDEAGLQLQNHLDLHFGEPEREIFRRAGKEAQFEEACRVPAVLVAIWRRR